MGVIIGDLYTTISGEEMSPKFAELSGLPSRDSSNPNNLNNQIKTQLAQFSPIIGNVKTIKNVEVLFNYHWTFEVALTNSVELLLDSFLAAINHQLHNACNPDMNQLSMELEKKTEREWLRTLSTKCNRNILVFVQNNIINFYGNIYDKNNLYKKTICLIRTNNSYESVISVY